MRRKEQFMRRIASAITLTLMVSMVPAFAADGPPPPVRIVAAVLELSPAQIESWLELLQAREAALQPLQQLLQAKRQTIEALLQSPQPDAAAVGQAVIEARNIEQQVHAIVMQTNAQFEAALTPDQQTRLQRIREAAQVCPAVPAFQATGLL
jgi:uncharacterized membrane protein